MKQIGRLMILLAMSFTANFALADTFETGWDRPGFDYHNFDMMSARPIICQWQCQKDNRCKAWTYVRAGIQGPKPRCWLKNRVPRAIQNSCCTSGIIQ